MRYCIHIKSLFFTVLKHALNIIFLVLSDNFPWKRLFPKQALFDITTRIVHHCSVKVFAAILGFYEYSYVIWNISLLVDLGSNFQFTKVCVHTCNNGILKSLFLYGS